MTEIRMGSSAFTAAGWEGTLYLEGSYFLRRHLDAERDLGSDRAVAQCASRAPGFFFSLLIDKQTKERRRRQQDAPGFYPQSGSPKGRRCGLPNPAPAVENGGR